MAEEHECPYDGYGIANEGGTEFCGTRGSLCAMCKEDRADRRAKWVAGELHDLWEAILVTLPRSDKQEEVPRG